MNDFQQLVEKWLNGELTGAESEQLNRQLAEGQSRRVAFAEQVQFHSLLRKRYRIDASLVNVLANGLEGRVLSASDEKRRRGTPRSLVIAVAAVSIVLVVMALPSAKWGADAKPGAPHDVAQLHAKDVPQGPVIERSNTAAARVEKATSEIDSAVWRNGILYPGDRIQFGKGSLRLRFLVGATVDLEGPADLEIASANRAVLHAGQATADVEEAGHGFTIATPTADVVDLGTKFGVKVEAGQPSDVVVFEGVVDVGKVVAIPGQIASGQRLRTGEAVRLDAVGQQSRIPMIWQRSSPAGLEWSSVTDLDSHCAISSVRDNLSLASRPKFYAIVPKGFQVNAKAHVDRPYVWTGWNNEELPAELRGGDYIQTFCDNKEEEDFELHVGISAPSRVYVLFDSRIKRLPEWLTSGFANTGLEVGLKGEVIAFLKMRREMESLGKDQDPALINPDTGNTQRYRFSVWKCDVPGPGEVFLGAVAAPTQSMYGIVVKPR